MQQRMFIVVFSLALFLGGYCSTAVSAYPDKPIRFIVPFAPGGGSDFVGRLLGAKMTAGLGEQVVVDNRPGAGGLVGTQLAAKASGDGYTLLLIDTPFTVNVSLYKNAGYDPIRNFSPITIVATVPLVLVVNPSVKATSVEEFVGLAKAQAGKLNMASGGTGGIAHLAGALFTMVTGAKFTHVPYKGIGPGLTAVVGGEVPFMFATSQAAASLIKSGKIRALAVTSARRSQAMPEIPTVAEAGIAGYEITNWYGVVSPAGAPKPAVTRLYAELVRTLHAPDVLQRFAAVGLQAETSKSPGDFSGFIQAQVKKWGKVVKASGMTVE